MLHEKKKRAFHLQDKSPEFQDEGGMLYKSPTLSEQQGYTGKIGSIKCVDQSPRRKELRLIASTVRVWCLDLFVDPIRALRAETSLIVE